MPHPPRLHRLGTIFVKTPVYFVTLCTHERQRILAHPALHSAFVAFSERAVAHGASVGRYVIMPDHIHLFAAFAPAAVSLSLWVKSLKNSLSKSLRLSGHPAPHWQKGFFDHVLRSADSYSAKWDYVRANPVRAGFVSSPHEWPSQGVIHDLAL